MKRNLLIVLLILYLQNLAFGQKYDPTYFSKQEIENDLQYLKEKVVSMHPKFLNKVYSENWQIKCDALLNNLADSISFNESFVAMSGLLAGIKDEHTSFNFSYDERRKYMLNGGVTMPFTICVKNNKLFINEYFGENQSHKLEGAELLSINSIESQKLLNDVRILAGTENSECGDQSVERLFGMCYWMLYGEAKEYHLKTAEIDSVVKVKAVSNSRYFELKNKYYPKLNQKAFDLKFSDKNELAILKIQSFYDTKKLASFFEYAFDTIAQNKCANLIIDVRDNPGGRSSAVDSLMNYLINKPYSQYSSISIRVSDEIKNNYKERRPEIYSLIADLPNDSLYQLNDSLFIHTPAYKTSQFRGNVFVLVNGRTLSAAATFAGVIRENKIGEIIGCKPTGGTIRYYGDYLTFELPNTGMKFVVSPKKFVQYGGENPDQGVILGILLDNDDCSIADLALKCKGN